MEFHYRANRHMDDTINVGLHYIHQHLDILGAFASILFVDFSFEFSTIISKLLANLHMLQQAVHEAGRSHVQPHLTLSTGAPQRCVLSLLCSSLYTNDYISCALSVMLIMFADYSTLIGQISNKQISHR